MLNEFDVIRDVTSRLTKAGIPHMLTIISKLHWARESHSELQLGDVKNLLASGYDVDYLEHWTRVLGLTELLKGMSK